ncbi:hypothetical protein, partial [Streptomyces halstedii]|uniref:hypothetical protein n=1 Tax=Streptomyces halstedii TaxID=1944 RepID=UPI0033A4FD92
TGIYVMEPEVFDYVQADTSVDWSGDVFPQLMNPASSRPSHRAPPRVHRRPRPVLRRPSSRPPPERLDLDAT